ncbi:murein L,D-transpeptidase [Enemella evansiae]|uniref:L,D-transpeptidase family protein n=1 Tax=Enemella evansiae TaxID=2016499 RepID=UPI000B95CEEB|nr:L,D-transpeptidase family protein [Enemella evansiae]OYN98036.1 murein L,D-transpeptidase [Enemella evansiae]
MALRTARRTPVRSALVRPALALSVLVAVPLAGCAKPTTEVATPAPAPTIAPVDTVTPLPAPTPVDTATPTPTPAVLSTPTATPTRSASRTATPRPTRTATPTPKPAAGPALLARGASGDQVRDLQARLKQIGWFDENVTGFFGPTTAAGVEGFQAKRGLPSTGAVDRATLTALQQMTRTPTEAEKADAPKPTPTPTPSSRPTEKAEPGGVPAGIDPRCMTGRVLCISKTQNKLRWMIDGKVQNTVDVRFGTEELPTREGTFSVQWKSRNHVSTIYNTPMPYAMFFSGGQAVHYSADFAANGYNGGSHGCVNVRDRATIAKLFDIVKEGDKVIVYR